MRNICKTQFLLSAALSLSHSEEQTRCQEVDFVVVAGSKPYLYHRLTSLQTIFQIFLKHKDLKGAEMWRVELLHY